MKQKHTYSLTEGEPLSAGRKKNECRNERRPVGAESESHGRAEIRTRVPAVESYWKQPLKWNREAQKAGERRRVFCASLADVFEDHPAIMPGWRARLGDLIYRTPHLDWLLLTKRPENVNRLLPDFWINFTEPYGMPSNVWLGTTVENQEQADKRIPELLKIPARVRFLSCEPLLSNLDLSKYLLGGSQDDNQRNGSFSADCNRCAVCGQARQDMATQGNYAGIGNFRSGDCLRTEASGRGAIREGWLSQGSSDNREDSIYRTGTSDCLDGIESARNPHGMRDQSQGWSERQQPAREPGTGNSIRELASLAAYAGQLPEQESDGSEINTRTGFGNSATQRRKDHASCSNCGNVQGQHSNGSEYCEPLKVGMDSRSKIHWVIAGGESGPNARPMRPDWARSLRDQCQAAGAAFHFKQWGEWGPQPVGDWDKKDIQWLDGVNVWRVGKKAAGRTLDGLEWDQFPV